MNEEAMAVEGGLTDANTAVGEFGDAATGAGTSATDATAGVGQMAGAVTGLGSTIGLAVSTVFRMQDAQLALDKANLKATKSTETARKAALAFDDLLKSATGNTAGITAARDELSAAQDNLNKMQEAGITSGAEYEAAQAAVGAATAALRAEFPAGGGDVAKFDAAINKMTNTQESAELATRSAEKAQRTFSQTALETGLSVASLVGQSVSAVAAIKDIRAGAEKLGGPLKKLAGVFTEGKTGAEGLTTALENSIGITALVIAGYKGAETVIAAVETAMAQMAGEAEKALEGQLKVLEAGKSSSVGGYIDLIDKIFGTSEALKKSLPQVKADEAEKKKAEEASKAAAAAEKGLGDSAAKTAADLAAAVQATNGNTTAIAALQRTHANLQMDIDRSGTSLDDFQQIMHTAKQEVAGGASSTETFTSALDAVNAGLSRTTGEAVKLSNVFPEMGTNIKNALLGQEQNMQVAIALWDNFNARVQAGQYEVGEFSKFIADMGYEMTPGVQAAVEQITEMAAAAESVTVSSKGAAAGVKIFGSASVDLSSTVGKTASAVSDMNLALVEQSYSLKASIAGLQDLGNQTQGVNNALLEVTNNFEKSNQSLREAEAVRASAAAQSQLLHTALNKETESLINEEAALNASIAATQDSAIQTVALSNAKLEGTNAAMEFISSLDEEKASQEASIAVLRQSVAAMGLFGDATLQTADQLEQFAAVAAGVPSAIRDLAGEIGGLAQEATKFLEFAGEEDELFGNWKIADTVPKEIRAMMSDADIAFIHGRAQLERTMESLGPLTGAKFAAAIQTAKQGGLGELRSFGTEAAAMLREGFPTMDAALRELTDSFAIMGTAADKDMIPAMAACYYCDAKCGRPSGGSDTTDVSITTTIRRKRGASSKCGRRTRTTLSSRRRCYSQII